MMYGTDTGRAHLHNEVSGLLNRLSQTAPFSLTMPMVAAAGISAPAMAAVNNHWIVKKRQLNLMLRQFLAVLNDEKSARLSIELLQKRYARIKLRFNSLLNQYDIFADVISQRAEHVTGVWVAGLDVLATDALQVPVAGYEAPPVMCFLERGHGAAIRKARTRLPGGDYNPVAIIQVPRERMVGSGVASSLIHETGHQGAALLDLITTIRTAMSRTIPDPQVKDGWLLLQRWLSEIIADFWAVAHLGIAATTGLMSVVSLPGYFMFRHHADDPHPFPWIRVKISLAFGEKLFPDPQWNRYRQLWHSLYPTDGCDAETRGMIRQIEMCLPLFVRIVTLHRNPHTGSKPLAALFPVHQRQPGHLRALFDELHLARNMRPSLVFAVVGQARADGRLNATDEGLLLSELLSFWALQRAVQPAPTLIN